MASKAVEILLVEDNPNDLELTLRALKSYELGLYWLLLEETAP